MNFKQQLFALELELLTIYEGKNKAVKNQKYELATTFRDQEKVKEVEIENLLKQIKNVFEKTNITNENYSEFKEVSKILYFYSDVINPFFKKKLKSNIRQLKIEKEESLLIQNYNLRREFTKQIQFLKEKLSV